MEAGDFFTKVFSALNKVIHPAHARCKGNRDRENGLTFMETIIVISIILLVAGTVTITAISLLGTSRQAVAKTQIDSFKTALETYYLKYHAYPTQEQGLDSLRKKPSLEPVPAGWDKPIVDREIPKDPWGNEYKFVVPSPMNDPYGIICYGADGKEGGEGDNADITSWQ